MSKDTKIDDVQITRELVEAVFEHAEPIVGCHECDGILAIGQPAFGQQSINEDKYALGLKILEVLYKIFIKLMKNQNK